MKYPDKIPKPSELDRMRFESKLTRDEATGCLLFRGSTCCRGYGWFGIAGKNHKAHRVAWVLSGQLITPDKPHILHNCPAGDNPLCCEVSHLWAGTNDDNARDRALKGQGRQSAMGMPFGVSRGKNRFRAAVYWKGKSQYLGWYDSPEEAGATAQYVKEIILGVRFLAEGAE